MALTGEKPLEFVISGNLKRRHLTDGQRAGIAVNVMPLLEEEAEKRLHLSKGRGIKAPQKVGEVKILLVTKVSQGKSREQASKIFDVGTTYIQQIKKIKQNSPEKLESIKSGKLTLQD